MKIIKKYSIICCIGIAVVLLLISLASYLFAGELERTRLAQLSCVFALLAIVIGLLGFDSKEK